MVALGYLADRHARACRASVGSVAAASDSDTSATASTSDASAGARSATAEPLQQRTAFRDAQASARIPARSGMESAVVPASDVTQARRWRARGAARIQLLLDQTERVAKRLRKPGGERGPKRSYGARAADHRLPAIDQNLVAGGGVAVARDIGHAPPALACRSGRHSSRRLPGRQRECGADAA